jgi:hypothetical protein
MSLIDVLMAGTINLFPDIHARAGLKSKNVVFDLEERAISEQHPLLFFNA